MVSVGVYIRVDKKFLEEFTKKARSLGMSRSEAIRRAMELFLEASNGMSATSKMRGIIKSRLSLKDLEKAYMVHKL